jgi:hypothetical protein
MKQPASIAITATVKNLLSLAMCILALVMFLMSLFTYQLRASGRQHVAEILSKIYVTP